MGCPDGGEQSLAKMTDAGEVKEKKAMIKKAVIFDADGTLWDSVDLVAKAFSIKLQDFPETKGIRISREDLLPLMGKTGDFLDMECYGNNGKKKAENIRILMERNHLNPEDCVYLGDTALDYSSATEAGIAFIHAAYGFGQVEGAERSISDLSELIHVLPFN